MRMTNSLLMICFMVVLFAIPIPIFAESITSEETVLDKIELEEATISMIQEAMDDGKLTAEDLVNYYLERIESYDQQGPRINSIITMNDDALNIARALDAERIESGPRSPLHGIPIVVKDNFNTVGMPTSAGCLCLRDLMTPDDAFQVKKLKEAGAIILAKVNLHEFAFGITTDSSLGGQTLNPYNLAHNPGGSSGGTGAAVAANFAVAGLGTDTGGSIRLPASSNNLVGIRVTMGLTSRDGIIPLALTQDIGGPMARTVEDIAYLLDATVGYDPNDIVTARSINNYPETYTNFLNENGLEGATIGVIRDLFNPRSTEVNDLIDEAIADMEELGAEIVDVTIDNLSEITSYPSLSSWEFKFQLNDYLESLGSVAPYSSLTEIIESGEYSPSIERSLIQRNERETLDTEEYKDILLFRTEASQNGLLKAMADYQLDALVYPTSTNPPAEIGRGQSSGSNNRLSAFSGFPAISVPAGFTSNGLPVGIEFLARPFEESTLIELAYAYEQHTKHRQAPQLEALVNKMELEKRIEEFNNEHLIEKAYTEASWQAFQEALTHAQQVLDNLDVTQAEVDDALNDLNNAYDELGVISISELKVLIEQFDVEGEFTNNRAAQTLITHLSAVEHFDKQDQAKKVLKHMKSLKTILEHQKSEGDISESAFDTIYFVANDVIQQLENNEQNHVA